MGEVKCLELAGAGLLFATAGAVLGKSYKCKNNSYLVILIWTYQTRANQNSACFLFCSNCTAEVHATPNCFKCGPKENSLQNPDFPGTLQLLRQNFTFILASFKLHHFCSRLQLPEV